MAERVVAAPVERVELFEDRAFVVRRVDLPPEPGRHLLRVGPVTPLLRERGVAVLPSPGALVEELRVEREAFTRAEAEPEAVARMTARHRELADQLVAARAGAGRAEERAGRARRAADAAWAWAGRALLDAASPLAWVERLRDLEEARRVAALDAGRLAAEADRLAREEAHHARLLALARDGVSLQRAWLVLAVLVRDARALRLGATVPCALWRPVHRACLRGGAVAWEVGATCWNATGEDWQDVELVCSTARPGGHASPPALHDDRLVARPRDREVVVEAREEAIQVAREGEARVADQIPGVDDGGEPRTYTAPGRVSVPSDGRPVQVFLERWEARAEPAWVACPERSAQVVLRTRQVHGGTRPLLAGPVELFRESGAVGRGRVGFVPPGEPFQLGWGSHDAVRVTRRRDHEVDRSRLTGRRTHAFRVAVRLVHLGDEPVVVQVRERVPVSELREVRVGEPRAEPALTEGPDADGFCRWEVALAPGEVRELSLAYDVEAAANVQLPW